MEMGPTLPSLEVLCDADVDIEILNRVIDVLFNPDSIGPPMLLRTGPLRPMIHTAFATMLTYHDERIASGAMRPETLSIRKALQSKGKGPGIAPTQLFSEWGSMVRVRFNTDHVHLTWARTKKSLMVVSLLKS